jgi:transcriptional regulator with XRE-family HTH domain
MTLSQNLGARIKYYRKLRRLTQERLAEKADLSLNFIGIIEIGRSTPSLKSLARIASALEVPLQDLFKFSDFSVNPQALKRKVQKTLVKLAPGQLELLCNYLDLLQNTHLKKRK